jgi:DNA-binding response OmpR family regulator
MAGAKAWVVKPFRPDQILHAVSKLVPQVRNGQRENS